MPSDKDAKGKKPEYTVLILPSAQKQLDKLPNAIANRIEDKMMELGRIPGSLVVKSSKAGMPIESVLEITGLFMRFRMAG